MIKDLITKKDLKNLEDKALHQSINGSDLSLFQESLENMKEERLQVVCFNIVKSLFKEGVTFQQNDNGGNYSKNGKIAKARTGTQAGFPDVTIWVWEKGNIFVEFKRIGEFKINEKQKYWHDFLKSKNQRVHYCNNTIYFEKVICQEIKEMLNANS